MHSWVLCPVFLFVCFFLVVSSHIMLPWRNRAEESKQFSMATDIFDCTWVDLSDLFSFRLFWDFSMICKKTDHLGRELLLNILRTEMLRIVRSL